MKYFETNDRDGVFFTRNFEMTRKGFSTFFFLFFFFTFGTLKLCVSWKRLKRCKISVLFTVLYLFTRSLFSTEIFQRRFRSDINWMSLLQQRFSRQYYIKYVFASIVTSSPISLFLSFSFFTLFSFFPFPQTCQFDPKFEFHSKKDSIRSWTCVQIFIFTIAVKICATSVSKARERFKT